MKTTSLPAILLLALLTSVLAACATGGSVDVDAGGSEPATDPAASSPASEAPASDGSAAADAAPSPTDPTAAVETPPDDPLSPAADFADDPAALKRGSDLFRALCTGYCHSVNAGEDTDASYLFDCDWSYGGTDREIFGVISEGIPDTRMQGFGGKLPDEELWKIVAFVRSKSDC